MRIDQVVVKHSAELGRRGVAELFRRGAVRTDGRVAKKGDRAEPGRTVRVVHDDATPIRPDPEIPLDVRLERADVVVVHKPAGRPTAPIRLGETGTLANALLARYPEIAGIGHQDREPGLLHRLDTQTSGLVVVTRTAAAFDHLWRALSEGRLSKRYLAVVESRDVPDAGVVETPLAPDPADPRRIHVARAGSGRASSTAFRRLPGGGRFALLEVTVSHAYRHQVRVHLASIGHPLVGDALYGGPEAPVGLAHAAAPSEPQASAGGPRHALHASYVAWAGDDAVPAFAVEDPLPVDLAALVRG